MKNTEFHKLIIYLAKSLVFLVIYLCLWFVLLKKIKNTIIRGIITGLTTPFFVYYFAMNFVYPASYFLKITNIYDPSVAVLLVYVFVKPISIFAGIMISAILLVKDKLN